MQYRDLRDFVTRLEAIGDLKRIRVEVDRDPHTGAVRTRPLGRHTPPGTREGGSR